MNTFEQGLDMQPSAPQGFPPWGSIAFAAQIPTIAGNGMPTLLDGHRLGKPMIQMSYDSHDVRWQDLASRLRGILSGGSSQLYQAHGHGSQQAQDGAQPFIVLHLTLLDLAAGFESLMKVFDHPAGTIPVDPLLRVLKRLGGDRTEQDPFEGFHTFGRLRLPDVNDPHQQGMPAVALLAARWQQAQWLPREQDVGRASLTLLAGVDVHRRAGLGRPTLPNFKEVQGRRAGTLCMMRTGWDGRLGLFHQQVDTAILGRTDDEVAVQFPAQAQERKDIAVTVSNMHPAYAFGRRSQRLDTAFPDEAFAFTLQTLLLRFLRGSRLTQKRF